LAALAATSGANLWSVELELDLNLVVGEKRPKKERLVSAKSKNGRHGDAAGIEKKKKLGTVSHARAKPSFGIYLRRRRQIISPLQSTFY
jgi:hypothetical protein